MLTALALVIFLALLALGFHQRHEPMQLPPAPKHILIGGQEPITLSRTQSDGGLIPEFVSAILLPGRGVNVLQINAYLPGHGIVPLLDAPTPDALQSSTADDRNGSTTSSLGGPFILPVDSRAQGTLSSDGQSISIPWHGRNLTLPTDEPGSAVSSNGLFTSLAARSVDVENQPDGQLATAIFDAGDFNGHWPSTSLVTVVFSLTRKSIEITVTALNTGSSPEPMGIGWRPFFAIPSGLRSPELLHMPLSQRQEMDAAGNPTGRILPITGTAFDYSPHNGVELGTLPIQAVYTHLSSGYSTDGPLAELQDLSDKYGLRIVPISKTIRVFHVSSPAGKPSIMIEPRMSLDDPFGRQLQEDSGLVTLAPGDSVQWKARMDIYLPLQHSAIP